MIVVVGAAAYRPGLAEAGRASGLAPEIAVAASAAGAAVELVSRIGDDGAGEELLLALGRAGVGHLAVLRDPARPTSLAAPAAAPDEDESALEVSLVHHDDAEAGSTPGTSSLAVAESAASAAGSGPQLDAADLSLGLAYLRDYRVVVALEPLPPGAPEVVADAARFAGAALVVVAVGGTPVPPEYGAATILEAPDDDPDGAFAALVGRYAVALDEGAVPAEAFHSAATAGGWEPAGA